MSVRALSLALFLIYLLYACTHDKGQIALTKNLVGYWPFSENAQVREVGSVTSVVHGPINFDSAFAQFDGRSCWVEIPASEKLHPGTADFSISAWIYTEADMDDVGGDIISQFDPLSQKGFHLSLKSNASPTSQSSYRQLQFAVDDGLKGQWTDKGRPGNTLLAFALAEFKSELYAGVCQPGANETGKVFRYRKGELWADCGAPDSSNSVTALAVFDGHLYAATGHYRLSGSSLIESENTTPGGRIFRYEAPGIWHEVGHLPGVVCIGGLAVYNGKLYASSMYAPSGFFRYDEDHQWTRLPNPEGKRVVNMATFNGYLYATSWDHGHVYRYNGESWEDCGAVGDNTQNYAFNIYGGNLYTATWPSGRVYRFDGIDQWADVGRLGEELEVMAMMTYNGRMMAGTLPLAEVYVYEGDTLWTRMDQLDRTPDVRYRRAWTMAEHDGKVFCSTLPSGKIFSYESGKVLSMSEPFPEGWQHVAAIKTKDEIRLYLNGKMVGKRDIPENVKFDLNPATSLKIGFGSNDYFKGRLKEIRFYKRALKESEILYLAEGDRAE